MAIPHGLMQSRVAAAVSVSRHPLEKEKLHHKSFPGSGHNVQRHLSSGVLTGDQLKYRRRVDDFGCAAFAAFSPACAILDTLHPVGHGWAAATDTIYPQIMFPGKPVVL